MATATETYRAQREFMTKILGGERISGDDVAGILEKLIEIVEDNQLFERDVCTGRLRSKALGGESEFLDNAQARSLFKTFFCDKLFVARRTEDGTKYRALPDTQQNVLFDQIVQLCTYNSRKEIYARIPEWDGTPRLQTFMKDYFYCDADWHFFLLLMTYIIGKIDNPAATRVEHWFDFVGDAKGTGKSTFFKHLLGSIGCASNVIDGKFNKRSQDDFFVDAYNANAIVVVDDECSWLRGSTNPSGISYDELKNLVTLQTDCFSRKFCQPETHDRGFVIVRTSNHPRTVYSLNERRQIIFNSNLPEQTCLHWQLDDVYMSQLLAEAKDYYEKNGVYQLTEREKQLILDQNLENMPTETLEYRMLEQFIQDMSAEPKALYTMDVRVPAQKSAHYNWVRWESFIDWANDTKQKMCNLQYADVFWRNVRLYCAKNPDTTWYEHNGLYRSVSPKLSQTKAFGVLKREFREKIKDAVDAYNTTEDIPY